MRGTAIRARARAKRAEPRQEPSIRAERGCRRRRHERDAGWRVASFARGVPTYAERRRRLFPTTVTEDIAIAPAANIGVIAISQIGSNTPAARGMAATL